MAREPTLSSLLTRIEILERHVERLEKAVTGIIGFGALVKRVERLEAIHQAVVIEVLEKRSDNQHSR